MAVRGACPWCRKAVPPGALTCPGCGFKLRDAPRAHLPPRAARPAPPGLADRLRALARRLRPLASRRVIVPGLVALAVALTPVVVWHVLTRHVRYELNAVQAHLESLPQLRNVRVSRPLFATGLPPRVTVEATALPSGYPSEVTVPVRGEYDTQTRVAVLRGRRQIFFPYEMVNVNWPLEVPPPER